MTSSSAEFLRTFGFVVLRAFFDPDPLAAEIDRVMRNGLSSRVISYEGISFQYVPMMTSETHSKQAMVRSAYYVVHIIRNAATQSEHRERAGCKLQHQ
jgi:hypothetical protein